MSSGGKARKMFFSEEKNQKTFDFASRNNAAKAGMKAYA
jgi:hypothetical protein